MTNQQVSKTQERTQTQCERVLDAAEQCFIKYGFHAASMANIAEAAQMSAGLIYRYFENKNAIILAIIERQLQIMRTDISALHTGTDLVSLITTLFADWQSSSPKCINPALFLEMTAHATRDPQIGQAMTQADQIAKATFIEWLSRAAKAQGNELTDKELQRYDLFVKCIIDGLAVRAVREPDLDPAFVAESLKLYLPRLLSFEKQAPSDA